MSRYDDSNGKLVAYGILFVLLAIFYLWFYAVEIDGVGVVQSKWVETNTSCDDDGCTTTRTYLVQFDDGMVMSVFWGTRHWDRMLEGATISYHARGRNIRFFGWRIMQPAIFSFEIVKPPP